MTSDALTHDHSNTVMLSIRVKLLRHPISPRNDCRTAPDSDDADEVSLPIAPALLRIVASTDRFLSGTYCISTAI